MSQYLVILMSSIFYEIFHMRTTRTIITLTTGLLLQFAAQADFVGLNIGSSFWNPDVSGSFNSTNNASNDVSVKGTNKKSQQSVTISFEHPIPAVPNIKFKDAPLSSSSSSNLSNSINFDNKSFSGKISSTLDVSHKDLVLYYKLLDNWVNLDLGLNFKTFEGQVVLNDSSNNNGTVNINETIPLIYFAARFDLPFTGFYVSTDIQKISLVSSTADDSTLMVGYESSSGIGIEGGYKEFSLKLDETNKLNTALDYNGLYINGYIHF